MALYKMGSLSGEELSAAIAKQKGEVAKRFTELYGDVPLDEAPKPLDAQRYARLMETAKNDLASRMFD
jgi:hypothetical protein